MGISVLYAARLFQYAVRQEWLDRNPVKSVAKKRVVEKEIVSLSLHESRQLLDISSRYEGCAAPVGLLIWAGIRPKELRRMRWRDLDLQEGIIRISTTSSKTGGARHVEMCPALKRWLKPHQPVDEEQLICPPHWQQRWESIRSKAGFKGRWVQDVLRHTYASYHARHHRDLPALQLNMGHRDCRLLHYRYVNFRGITRNDAKLFWAG